MTTYYEILQISSDTDTEEIETAYETQYHRWRRLVTHHDPTVVNKANQALQALETIHNTLTVLEKRAVYDATIGVRGPLGGLADPAALLQTASPIPPAPPAQASLPPTSTSSGRADAWICPNCQRANPIGTSFCKQCGQKLGRKCPKCQQLTEAIFSFCAFGGVDMDALEHEKQTQAQQVINKSLTRISNLIRQIQQTKSARDLQDIERLIVSTGNKIKRQLSQLPEHETEQLRQHLVRLMTEAERAIIERNRHRSIFDRWLHG